MTAMRGPLTHSTNEEVGLLVDGFETPPYVGMPYNPRHYPAALEAAGLAKAKDLHSWEIDLAQPASERLVRLGELARRRAGVTVRPANPRDYDADARRLMAIYNSAWERNWGFVPLTEREFFAAAAQLRPLVTRYPEGILIAEAAGEPVAFCLGVIDANQALARVPGGRLFPFGFVRLLRSLSRVDRARVLALGIRAEYRHLGLDAILVLHLVQLGRRLGLRCAELGWILEDNTSMRAIVEQTLGARLTRTYRVYEGATG
jgi:ribosomal protein S18 acetylase RimI-like enzyme